MVFKQRRKPENIGWWVIMQKDMIEIADSDPALETAVEKIEILISVTSYTT